MKLLSRIRACFKLKLGKTSYYGEKAGSIIYVTALRVTFGISLTGLFSFWGLSGVAESLKFPDFSNLKDSIAYLTAVFSSIGIIYILLIVISYLNETGYSKGKSITPIIDKVEDSSNRSVLAQWTFLLIYLFLPYMINWIFILRILYFDIYDVRFEHGSLRSRSDTLKNFIECLSNDCYRMGNLNGIQFIPVLSDALIFTFMIYSTCLLLIFFKIIRSK